MIGDTSSFKVDPVIAEITGGNPDAPASAFLPQNLPAYVLGLLRRAMLGITVAGEADGLQVLAHYLKAYIDAAARDGIATPTIAVTLVHSPESHKVRPAYQELGTILTLEQLRRDGYATPVEQTLDTYLVTPLLSLGEAKVESRVIRNAYADDAFVRRICDRLEEAEAELHSCPVCDRREQIDQLRVLEALVEGVNANLRHFDVSPEKPEQWAWRPYGALLVFESCSTDAEVGDLAQTLRQHGFSIMDRACRMAEARLAPEDCSEWCEQPPDEEKADAWADAFFEAYENHPAFLDRQDPESTGMDLALLAALAFERMIGRSEAYRFVHCAGKAFQEVMDTLVERPSVH